MRPQSDEIEEVRRLLHEHVPEIANGIVEIKGIERVRGMRVIVAVHSEDSQVNPVWSCIGQQGSRVKTILRQLQGERIDVVRWSHSPETFLTNLCAPAKIEGVMLNETAHSAVIFTSPDYKSLVRGKNGSRLEMISRLVG